MITFPSPCFNKQKTLFSFSAQSIKVWTASLKTRFIDPGPYFTGKPDIRLGFKYGPQVQPWFMYAQTESYER